MNFLPSGSPTRPAEIKSAELFHLFSRHANWRVTHMEQLVSEGSRQTAQPVTSRRFRSTCSTEKPLPCRASSGSSGKFVEKARERAAEGVWLFKV